MNCTVSVLFYIKRAKVNKDGICPIYVRVTVNSKRFEFSSNKFVAPDKWSAEASKIKGNNEEARLINKHLELLKFQILEAENKLIIKNVPISADRLREEILGVNTTNRMLIPIFRDHNEKIKVLVGTEYSPGTLERYNTSLKHTQDFLMWKFQKGDIDIVDIDHAFITDYEFWLRSVRKCANNTAVKYIKNFKKIIRICMANGWLDKDPFINYKSKVKVVERVFLTHTEIQTLLNKSFVSERLELVRDIFIFSCFTGLAYVDVKKLTKENLNIGIDGHKWIFTHRQKTDTPSRIPILPTAEGILEKYKDHPQCINSNILLPILSNQKMNAYLKEIADVCEINKELTFHIARHTFATTVTLSNGVPIESVSKMLGHTNIKTTQHYAKILDQKISTDMQVLKDRLKDLEISKIS